MVDRIQNQRLRHRGRRQRDHQECDRAPSSLFHSNASDVVQCLNNRASVLVSTGNFTEANRLYEVALSQHMKMTCERLGKDDVNASLCTDNETDAMNLEDDSCSEDDSGCDHPEEWTSNGIPNDEYNHRADDLPSISFQKTRLNRMSTNSQLKTVPYSGQGVYNKSSSQYLYHQIYSLPIVMDPSEWERASMEIRSFVLIFNSALCNHLQGMELLSQGHHYNQNQATKPPHQAPFEVAKILYGLALKSFSDAHSKHNKPGTLLLGIERICCSCLFNNLSHVYKTLDGHDSHQAFYYDTLLLKSVYWLLSLNNHHVTNQPSPAVSSIIHNAAASTAANGAFAAQNRHSNSANNNSSSGGYNDDEAELIDAFLENVFYLIGAPQMIAPAAAA